jgi:adenine modification enzyme
MMEQRKDFLYEINLFDAKDISSVIGFGEEKFKVAVIPYKMANEIIIKNHYSHKIYNGSFIHLGVFSFGKLLGVLQFGYAMNPASGGSIVKGANQETFLELNRMWLDDELPKNSESMAVSYAIKYIKKRYPKVEWIQSFADGILGKDGIVYQACNFGFYGNHIATFWEYEGVMYHNIIMTAKRGKGGSMEKILQANKGKAIRHDFKQFRYLYFLYKGAKKNCLLKELPYPKHYKAKHDLP